MSIMSWSKAGSHALTALNAVVLNGVFSDGCGNAKLLSSLCRKLLNLTVQVAAQKLYEQFRALDMNYSVMAA